ncbi:NUDIX domain-containing protein [Negadavirga shengliensis]|uniref:NUDIX domain-containing protein n=1 Tax=Negadavirga shengliensis TaxID=1389218 RepID=A0ABV9SYN7_9BACT
MGYTYSFPRPALTTDAVVVCEDDLTLLLIERKADPFEGKWALPGGFVEEDEEPFEACKRELREETHLEMGDVTEQLVGVYGKKDRDPRGWTVSVAYFFKVSKEQKTNVKPGSDSRNAGWFPLEDLPSLAFDHKEIIGDGKMLL